MTINAENIFPNDDEFISVLSNKQVYQMRGKFKAYLFERYENYGTDTDSDLNNVSLDLG